MLDIVRDACGPTPWAVIRPRLGKEKVRVQESLEASFGHTDVDGDDAVVDLADAAEVLTLHTGRVLTPLSRTRLVDDTDGSQRVSGKLGNNVSDVSLKSVACESVVPDGSDEELLESSHSGSSGECDWFDTLAWQV